MTGSGKKRSKERFETILEPLHAIMQVGFLSFYPVGTKLAIKGNMLIIQPPDYAQSMSRWYNNDTQDDLCYLFNVFTRFNKYYAFLLTEMPDLHTLLITNAVRGLEKLVRTYSDTSRPHILHTLNMYKQIALNKVEYNHGVDVAHTAPHMAIGGDALSSAPLPPSAPSPSSTSEYSHALGPTNSIDTVFCKIIEKYSKRDLIIIYNVLLILATVTSAPDVGGVSGVGGSEQGTREDYLHYINGVNQILHPVNVSIKKWIDENIVF